MAGGFVWERTPSLRWFQQEAPVYASELFFNTPKTFHVNILGSLNPYPPTSHTRCISSNRGDLVSFARKYAHKMVNFSHVGQMTQARLMLLISIGRRSLSCHGNMRCLVLMLWLPARLIITHQSLKMYKVFILEFVPE